MSVGIEPDARPEPAQSPSARPRRRRRWGPGWANLVVLLLVGGAVGTPIALLLLNSFNVGRPGGDAEYGWGNWLAGFVNPEVRGAIWNTMTLGVTRTVIALCVAVVLAWLIARTDMPGGKTLEFLLWLAFFIPSLPLTLGWILLGDPQYGLLNELLRAVPGVGSSGEGPLNIYSFWGIVWVHLTASTVPFMTVVIIPAFRRMNVTLEESARVCGASRWWTALRVTVPVMTPAILAAGMLSFIWSLKAFEVELLLGTPIGLNVYSTQIYEWVRSSPPQFGIATALGSAFIVLMVAMSFVYRRALRGKEFTTVGSHTFSDEPVRLGRVGRYLACAGCLAFILVGVVLPVGFVVVGSFMRRYGFFDLKNPFTTEHWSSLLGDSLFTSALWNTLALGVGATVFGLAVYLALGNIIIRSRLRTRSAVDVLAWLPVAVPGILLSLGLLWVYLGTPLRTVLYGNVIGLIIAIVIGHMATGTQQAKGALLQISTDLEGVARVCGAGRLYTHLRIMLPLLGPALAGVAVLTFASAVRDISTVVLLSSHESRPLSILMLEYSFGGELERGAALGVLLSVLMAVFALIARRIAGTSLRG